MYVSRGFFMSHLRVRSVKALWDGLELVINGFLYPSEMTSSRFLHYLQNQSIWIMTGLKTTPLLPRSYPVVLVSKSCEPDSVSCFSCPVDVSKSQFKSKRKLYTIVGRSYNSSKTLCIPGPIESSSVTQQTLKVGFYEAPKWYKIFR